MRLSLDVVLGELLVALLTTRTLRGQARQQLVGRWTEKYAAIPFERRDVPRLRSYRWHTVSFSLQSCEIRNVKDSAGMTVSE